MVIFRSSSMDLNISNLSKCYVSRNFMRPVPRFKMPTSTMSADDAYRLVSDELMLDGNSRLNLATFVSTWMEPEAKKLMSETLDKNLIDRDEYPHTSMIERRVVCMLSELYNFRGDSRDAIGVSTAGSSESAMLAGMAMKWLWKKKNKKNSGSPNMIMSSGVQVVWEKFCRYWEIEPRYVEMSSQRYVIDAELAASMADENTIGVVAVLGTTYTGAYESVKDLSRVFTALNSEKGWDIGIHVDAASGGFVAPFIDRDLVWDFRLPLVRSINVSGHKYGLVYPGVGWVLWSAEKYLPQDLIFHVNYLGGDMPTFTLNFSRSASMVVAQYYNFLRLGVEGYTKIMDNLRSIARYVSSRISESGYFDLLGDGSELPVIAFKLKGEKEGKKKGEKKGMVFALAHELRRYGWTVPAYTMPPGIEDCEIIRLVIREGFSRDMADMLLDSIDKSMKTLMNSGALSSNDGSIGRGIC